MIKTRAAQKTFRTVTRFHSEVRGVPTDLLQVAEVCVPYRSKKRLEGDCFPQRPAAQGGAGSRHLPPARGASAPAASRAARWSSFILTNQKPF